MKNKSVQSERQHLNTRKYFSYSAADLTVTKGCELSVEI